MLTLTSFLGLQRFFVVAWNYIVLCNFLFTTLNTGGYRRVKGINLATRTLTRWYPYPIPIWVWLTRAFAYLRDLS